MLEQGRLDLVEHQLAQDRVDIGIEDAPEGVSLVDNLLVVAHRNIRLRLYLCPIPSKYIMVCRPFFLFASRPSPVLLPKGLLVYLQPNFVYHRQTLVLFQDCFLVFGAFVVPHLSDQLADFRRLQVWEFVLHFFEFVFLVEKERGQHFLGSLQLLIRLFSCFLFAHLEVQFKFISHFRILQQSIQQKMQAEPHPTVFQLKMQLLRTLKEGDIERSHQLITRIQSSTKINPELYNKFSAFISDNKQGLLEMERQERSEAEPPKIIIENIDGDLSDEYNSDDSWSLSSDQPDESEVPLKESMSANIAKPAPKPVNCSKASNLPKKQGCTATKVDKKVVTSGENLMKKAQGVVRKPAGTLKKN